MSFMDDLENKALPVRQAILRHPFVTGIGDGTLDVDKFRFYVRQDYLYLIDYGRVIALAAARSPDIETMGWFARLLDGTLNVEMDLHRGYCAEFGISSGELEATPVAPTTMAYTRFLSERGPPRHLSRTGGRLPALPVGLLGNRRPSGTPRHSRPRAPLCQMD